MRSHAQVTWGILVTAAVFFLAGAAHAGEEHHAQETPPGGELPAMARFYAGTLVRVGEFPGKLVCLRCDLKPGPMAATVHGLFFGRVAPPAKIRRTLPHPALVVGHPRDPIHLASDARMVSEELERASYVEASSILEWRLRPERLTERSIAFLDEAWAAGRPETEPLSEVGRAVLS